MARPKPAMPTAAAILALADADGQLEVRVSPGASADAITAPVSGGALAVRTRAPPEDGRANAALLRLLAKALRLPVSALELVRGAASRSKLIRLPPCPLSAVQPDQPFPQRRSIFRPNSKPAHSNIETSIKPLALASLASQAGDG
jgi:uncharacterized protein YggU (UPF0235/DUF167 family)